MIWHPSISLTLYMSIPPLSCVLLCQKAGKRPGEHAFSVVAPKLWNELPTHVKMAPTLDTLKSRLKTYFYSLAFNTAWELCGFCLSFTVFLSVFYLFLLIWSYCLLYAFNLLHFNFKFLYFTVLYLLCSTLVTLLFLKCAIQIKWIGLDHCLKGVQPNKRRGVPLLLHMLFFSVSSFDDELKKHFSLLNNFGPPIKRYI